MIEFAEIQDEIDLQFRKFLASFFRLDHIPLKYFYWSEQYFRENAGLNFSYFNLDEKQKEQINHIGTGYFGSPDVYFEVNENSHRHDILIKNFSRIFTDGRKTGQKNRYEYIKEFIFFQILDELSNSNAIPKGTVAAQKQNFLITYLKYLLEHTKMPSYPEFKGYMRFMLTNQGEDVARKLKRLAESGVSNERLENKLKNLYVFKELESKIHFVFSMRGGEEKEELRELLDVMGRKDTGKLYRGQADSMWMLNASLTREPKFLKVEADMYYDILSLKPDAFTNDYTVYERLITMQHFGMPTRLMDITRNPLVAIFFACNNKPMENKDGLVFTFAPKTSDFINFEDEQLEDLKLLFNNSGEKESSEFLKKISYIKGIAKNQRINSQSGDFIFVGDGNDINDKVQELPALSIIIDAPTKKTLLEQLESLNIHGGAVYPDLTHMSSYIKDKFLKDKSIVPSDSLSDIDLTPFEPKKSKKKVVEEKPEASTDVKRLTTDFRADLFWTPPRKKAFEDFAAQNNLNLDELKKTIEDVVAFEEEPIRSDVAKKIMKEKVGFGKYQTVVQSMLENIVDFAKSLENVI